MSLQRVVQGFQIGGTSLSIVFNFSEQSSGGAEVLVL
jgi:hypothetical protein